MEMTEIDNILADDLAPGDFIRCKATNSICEIMNREEDGEFVLLELDNGYTVDIRWDEPVDIFGYMSDDEEF